MRPSLPAFDPTPDRLDGVPAGVRIGKMAEQDYGLLEDFLYEAVFVPEGIAPPTRSIVRRPELQVYIADFGKRPDDVALVAEVGAQAVGAVWARIMEDYGHIDDRTPSLAIALYKDFRGTGIGTALMKAMLRELERRGYGQTSLAVQKANYAVKMYRNIGFEIVGENPEEYIMAYRFRSLRPAIPPRFSQAPRRRRPACRRR